MKKVKLIEKEYVYYVFIDGLFVRGGEKLNHLFADTGWDMFEEAIHTFESVKRECEKEETEVVINGEFKTMVVTYCRHKENINGEFGEWKPSQQVEYK